ncbi:MAG: DUF4810 domain-containing protein [Pseudomonadota bacterium]|nr:DUF4810 domain-containing protein [Pseudomonadota bacterium]
MKLKLLACCLVLASLTGCVAPQPSPTGFYWGNYSKYFYEYKKNPNEQTLKMYKLTLEKIIKESDVNPNRKVPPGIYAELGNIYLQQGNKDEALKWFQQEQIHYPESALFMKTMMEKAKS